ncbi:glycosyltransferase [Shewanella sp. 5_MG-2023]|uniref:glycosyltransferase n=1 Tax=Shewanella sp. 5_MG-2023 TaxID=3062656 RepID=UPI0034C6221B
MFPTEVIIADDGSKQETKALIDSYRAQKLPFTLIHCWQEDLGFRAAKSRNNAIQASTADYVICIDGDIILHPRFVEDHLSNAKKNQVIAGKRVRLSQNLAKR